MRWSGLLLAFLVIAQHARSEDWPQWLGPRRDGGTDEKIAPWKADPKVVWRFAAPKGYSSPVVAQGRVFVHVPVDGKNEEEVVALDAVSGKILWRDASPMAFVKGGQGPRATPAVAGKRVFSIGSTGILTCVDVESGKRLWQVDTYKQLNQAMPKFGVCCSPVVVGNVVLISVGGQGTCLAAFDTAKGELLWKGYDEPASTSSPVLIASPKSGAAPDVLFMSRCVCWRSIRSTAQRAGNTPSFFNPPAPRRRRSSRTTASSPAP